MKIKSNGLLKFVVPALVLVVLVVGLRMTQFGGSQQPGDDEMQAQLTPEQMKALGVEAEGPQDTVATLVNQVRKMRSDMQDTRSASKKLREQNQDLVEQQQDVNDAVQQALAREDQVDQKRYQSMIDTMQRKLSGLRTQLRTMGSSDQQQSGQQDDMPIGTGLNGTGGGTMWVDPLGMHAVAAKQDTQSQTGDGGSAFATAFEYGRKTADKAAETLPGAPDPDAATATPVYTVPKNATLVGSVSMTALLGRVPVDGTVQNPYPFKIVVGPENLTANGIMLPELQGAVIAGTAVGDWTLSCVRGKVDSITFTFQDGTVRTVPEPKPIDKGDSDTEEAQIGYISNPQGVPCVPGARKTNARSYILTNLLLSAGAAAADAWSGGETTTSVSALGSSSAVTGDAGKYIAGSAVASGLNEVRKWIQKRFGQTFDAVYVPPGQPVAVNITRQLLIDYNHQGRKVHYVQYQRAQGLD